MPVNSSQPLLKVTGLKKYFPVRSGLFSRVSAWVKAVDDITLYVNHGETLGGGLTMEYGTIADNGNVFVPRFVLTGASVAGHGPTAASGIHHVDVQEPGPLLTGEAIHLDVIGRRR